MNTSGIAKLLIGLIAVFALFQWLAANLGSFRGDGVVVAALILRTF